MSAGDNCESQTNKSKAENKAEKGGWEVLGAYRSLQFEREL